jgi:flagellar biosynthesis protein FliP
MEPIIPYSKLSSNPESFPQIIAPFLRIHTDSEIYQRLATLRKLPIESDKEKQNEPTTDQQPESRQMDSADDLSQNSRPVEPVGKPISKAEFNDFGLLVASFTISQLRDAFEIGFALLVPFLIIDLLVMNLLMVLGATAVNVELISIPLKILLFFSVDGWTMISEKLLKEFM